MRSSKSRSRGNKNRQARPSGGNIVNRVFDSSGPEGKVRGTPQQIIEKYTQLHRDAQLSGDRVNAENYAQHAEHYTRMLAEAMREIDRAREEQEQANRDRQAERDRQNAERQQSERQNADRQQSERPSQERAQNDRAQQDRPQQDRQSDRQQDRQSDRQQDGRQAERERERERRLRHQEELAADPSTAAQPDLPDFILNGPVLDDSGEATDSGLVETPEMRSGSEAASRPRPAPRKRPAPAETGEESAAPAEAPEEKAAAKPRARKPRAKPAASEAAAEGPVSAAD